MVVCCVACRCGWLVGLPLPVLDGAALVGRALSLSDVVVRHKIVRNVGFI